MVSTVTIITTPSMPKFNWINNNICVCISCGARANSPETMEHSTNCKIDSPEWEKIYTKGKELEDEWCRKHYGDV